MLKKICKIGCIVLVVGLLGTPAWSVTSGVVATDQTDNPLILAGNGPGDGDGDGKGPGAGPGDGDCKSV